MVKTPHRLIHDAYKAGAITEQEWRAFMRARNEVKSEYWLKDLSFFQSKTASEALDNAFRWSTSGGYHFWAIVYDNLYEYEEGEKGGIWQ